MLTGWRPLAWMVVSCAGLVVGCRGGGQRQGAPAATVEAGTAETGRTALDASTGPASAASPARPAPPDLALIYAGSLRGRGVAAAAGPTVAAVGGLAGRATLVDVARLQARAVVQVDAGDFLPATSDEPALAAPGALERRARLVLAAYRRMDVDAVTLGARELQLDPRIVAGWLREAKLTAVLANVVGGNGKPLFDAQRVIEAGDVKVGLFGVVELGEAGAASIRRWRLSVSEPIAAAKAAVAAARSAGATLIVGLFNLAGGLDRARQIAAAVPGIDVLVVRGADGADGATAGAVLPLAGPGQTPLLINAGSDATEVGRLDLRRPQPAGDAPWTFDHRRLPLDASVRDQLGVQLLVRADTAVLRGLQPPPQKIKIGNKTKKGDRVGTQAASPPEFHRGRSGTLPGFQAKKKAEPEVYETWTFASNGACTMCHQAQAQQWLTTDHAHAFATLKKKGRDRDPRCVGCHAVAFLQPGGTWDLDTVQRAFADVGCESCHGPSVAHVRSTDKTKGTSRQVDPLICLGCHTPDQSFGPLDLAAAMKEVIGPGHGAPAPPTR